ncbi:hypothetical protein FRC03_000176, partial [Tulasnella sp. 419]
MRRISSVFHFQIQLKGWKHSWDHWVAGNDINEKDIIGVPFSDAGSTPGTIGLLVMTSMRRISSVFHFQIQLKGWKHSWDHWVAGNDINEKDIIGVPFFR